MASAAVIAAVQALPGDFASLEGAVVGMHADAVAHLVSQGHFGTALTEAHAMLTAHRMVRLGAAGGLGGKSKSSVGGMTTSVSAGRMSRTRAHLGASALDLSDAGLMTTVYGEQFLSLRDSRGGIVPLVVF
jgi:hypothetical protein